MQRLPPPGPPNDAKLFGILLAGMFAQTRVRDASESRLRVATTLGEADQQEPQRER